MSTVGSDDNVMANNCLEIFQVLVSHGQNFSFSLTIGSKVPFGMNIRMGSATLEARRKNISPSQVRRNVKRKEDFLKKSPDIFKKMNTSKWLPFFVLDCTWLHLVVLCCTWLHYKSLGCTWLHLIACG